MTNGEKNAHKLGVGLICAHFSVSNHTRGNCYELRNAKRKWFQLLLFMVWNMKMSTKL